MEQHIIVVKLGYLFAGLRDIAQKAIMALSPGFTTLLLEQLPYKRIVRPIYPLDTDLEWSSVTPDGH
jgi:microcystin degradation protein MlrC